MKFESFNKIARHSAWIAIGAFFLSLAGCKTVNTEIMIAASPATVWKIISDAPGFQEWNPVHVRIEGEFKEGAPVKIHLKDPKGKVTAFPAIVRRMVPERLLNQGGGTPGLFTFNHTFSLEPDGNGTRFTQREEFRGVGVLFFGLGWVDESYRTVNQALKEKAESLEKSGMPR
ncbi:MAG: SRPBCC domain-containing protein [Spirochaetes bacterium]|nr:MAG: SRPBCC domain-containing protein [Spirochaetota bacterium]